MLAQDTAADRARQARILFESGDPQAAIEIYESLIAEQIADPAIYINLGHAYSLTQDAGKALLSYRRAQRMNPRDPELSTYLARLRTLRVDIQGDDVTLIDSLTTLTSSMLTVDELGWLALGLWMGFFSGLTILIVKARWRNNMRSALLVGLVVTISVLILWASRAYTERFRPAAIVLPPAVIVWSGPNEQYLELYELHAAAEMRLLERQGSWVRFVLPDGRQGWINETAIETI